VERGPVRFDVGPTGLVAYQSHFASGPGGMTISPAGKIRWDVPRDFADPGCEATVQIRDASGRELSEVLRIPLE